MNCSCLRGVRLEAEDPKIVSVLRRDGYRCLSCRGAPENLGIHSLIPNREVTPEITITVCYWCHVKIGKGTLGIKNHPKVYALLEQWAAKHPDSIRRHADYFPSEILDDIRQRTESTEPTPRHQQI